MKAVKRMKFKLVSIIIIIVIGCTFYYIKESDQKQKDHPIENKQDQQTPDKDDKTNKDDHTNTQTIITDPNQQDEQPQHKEQDKQKVIKLDVPQSVQENNYFCVPACVQMVLRYHDIEVSQTQLSKEMHTDTVTGTEYIDLANTLNAYLFHKQHIEGNEPGYRVQTLAINDQSSQSQALFEQRVKSDIASHDPVFTAIDVMGLYPDLYHGNHMIIVIGYASTNDVIDYYYIIDSSYTVQDQIYGGLKIVGRHELYQAIIHNEEPAYIW